MTNDVSDTNPEEAVPCIAFSKNGSYVMPACGGKVSLFNMMTFKVKTKMIGHLKRITGLAFKNNLIILVSFGADAQANHQKHQKAVKNLGESTSKNSNQGSCF
ncbi:protein TPR1-like [Dioscorea cayenensis subsp. rotundata]|uniref:Protein TPR1-like n=1 Tax=Dioscorea cayennensis subsp. rotundata TaxID=55577 RepID=A0AB40BXS7_DIOCR|nr:protein TPR1-like [Dioscorea cayenensis subsp. rotundata]